MPKQIPQELEYILSDILHNTGEYSVKPMFGGYALYKNGKIFAIYTSHGDLYFKSQPHNKELFIEAGGKPFVYARNGFPQEVSYYTFGEELLDDPEKFLHWVEVALDY